MDKQLYVMLLQRGKTYNKVNRAAIERHVENIRTLDESGKLALCGPLKGFPGVAGMFIFKTESYEEAESLCKQEPLVVEGYAAYKLGTLQVADRENGYLL